VTLMALEAGEKMRAAVACGKLGVRVAGLGRGGQLTEVELAGAALAAHAGQRARKGVLLKSRLKEPALRKRLPPPAPPA
jgi:topoisomerase-4 subunit A